MACNVVRLQHGVRPPDFLHCFGTENACVEAAQRARWLEGFGCRRCGGSFRCVPGAGPRGLSQCRASHHRASPTAGILFAGSRLPPSRRFLAICLISEAKTRMSALALAVWVDAGCPTVG